MVKYSARVLLFLISIQANAAGFVFDDAQPEVGHHDKSNQVVSDDAYRPEEPPRGSYSPMMDYDPQLTSELTQRPGETDQQYLERTKLYYQKSVTEMHGNLERLNQAMRDLAPQNVLGKGRK